MILMADPQVAAVPVTDCGEALVDLAGAGFLGIDDRERDPAGTFTFVRSGVAARLAVAAAALPAGIRLVLVEGYRATEVQRRLFEDYRERLARLQPDSTAEQLHLLASRYLSPPELAPHTAGAAVDVTLTGPDGAELDLGTVVNATPEDSAGACFTDSPLVTAPAGANRRLLAAAMGDAGFVNYPTEWWHWSYGDRYWALMRDQPAAIYGPVAAPR